MMMIFEYKVVPAPKKGKKAKGIRGTEGKFARALEDVMNDLATEGWEYQRTDTLPSETRAGLTGKTTVFQNMLIFRRSIEAGEDAGETETPVAVAVAEAAEPHVPTLPAANEAQALPDNLASLDGKVVAGRDVAAE